MSRKVLLALLLAGVLLAAPMVARADEAADEEYDDEEEGDSSGGGDPSEKDVVVIGDKNWTEVVGKSKYALVRPGAWVLNATTPLSFCPHPALWPPPRSLAAARSAGLSARAGRASPSSSQAPRSGSRVGAFRGHAARRKFRW